jgi:peptidyl-tRNA hydrolase
MSIVKKMTEKEILCESMKNQRPSDVPFYRMYSVVRLDLGMTFGDIISQTGDAYNDSLSAARKLKPEIVEQYRTWSNEQSTIFNGGSKFSMSTRNKEALIDAYNLARETGIPCAMIVREGHIMPPHFDGNPIITALGIGPCTEEEAADLVKHFTLMDSSFITVKQYQ